MNRIGGHSAHRARNCFAFPAVVLLAILITGCSTSGASGPSAKSVARAEGMPVSDSTIRVLDVTSDLTNQMLVSQRASLFSVAFASDGNDALLVGKGDQLDIAIWEAPPATLFGSTSASFGSGNSAFVSDGSRTARQTGLLGQNVDENGKITVPFVGAVQAAGRTTSAIAQEITRGLRGKAHEPQVSVKLSENAATNATVIGEVAKSLRMPLTAKRERLLDALAAAGGTRQPVGKTTIQVTRGNLVETLPLITIITDPVQNITLKADDVITALFQPYSFTALGAIGRNSEIDFEGTGLTLAQALGRVGGLDDNRANARSIFIFRLEDKNALGLQDDPEVRTTPDGKVPVIFRVNLRDPGMFFLAQSFPIKNKDVMYVSNAPLADIQKFINIVGSLVYPAINIQNSLR
tara:strand:+ start:21278 stop:22498 length:1221 start_codon:yes stop_codon:yes gene_type:complete